MSNRTKYLLLMALVTIVLFVADRYVTSQKKSAVKSTTTAENLYSDWYPESTTRTTIVHNYYTLSYNEAAEQAEWVAYWLDANQVVNQDFDRPYFKMDTKVSSSSAHWRNYKNSGYDRGHLCPAADREFNYEAFQETFLTSNVSPQIHEFNSGVWNYLEQRVRRWATQNDGVFVITGGVLKDPIDRIGDQDVYVPNAFYKIVVDSYRDEFRTIAFLIPHKKDLGNYMDYVVTIDQIEAATGIDFFASLPEEVQAELETRVDRLYYDL